MNFLSVLDILWASVELYESAWLYYFCCDESSSCNANNYMETLVAIWTVESEGIHPNRVNRNCTLLLYLEGLIWREGSSPFICSYAQVKYGDPFRVTFHTYFLNRCREKQRKESSRLQTVNRKLTAMNKLLMEENDRLQKQVSHLVYNNGYMRQKLNTVSSPFLTLGFSLSLRLGDIFSLVFY